MKRSLILLLFVLGTTSLSLQAEETKDLYFNYIVHDRTSTVQSLSKTLRNMYNDAMRFGYACIFYLANGDNPIIVRVNYGEDNRDDFNSLLGEIQNKTSHEVSVSTDLEYILQMFNANDFVNEDNSLRYPSVTWNMYTSRLFWELGYNESFISALHWIFGLDSLEQAEFYLNVYHASLDELKIDEKLPFGEKNLNRINDGFMILEY